MDEEERKIRLDLKNDFIHYAKKCLKIRTKAGDIKNLILNKAQNYIHQKLEEQKRRTGKVRALVLKGRQQGCSTLIGARFYHTTTHNFGIQTFILTHSLEATNNLFKMAQRFYENTPELVKPDVSTNNTKALIFGELDSGYKVGTAETKNVGRSATIQLLHCSEVAFWSNAADHATGIIQAVPDAPNTEIIMESTACGLGNYFHECWQLAQSGISDFIPIFVPWYWQDEYKREPPDDFKPNHVEYHLQDIYGLTNAQLAWRRSKIVDLSVNGQDGEKSFMQEYPCNATEAFQLTGENTFIDSHLVMQARKCQTEKYGPLIMGVDPARMGDDRTSIIFRQGRMAFGLESYSKKDTMEVTGIVHMLIEKHHPARVFIDIGGLGAGIVDRLKELGHGEIVVGINAGGKPLDANKYYNKRAEMWGKVADWLADIPVQIPDDNSLHADLCGIRYSFDSNSRLVMEKKEDMKKRGIRSPDSGDSLCFVGDTLILTPKGNVPISTLEIGDEVITPFGVTKISKCWTSNTNQLTTAKFSNGSILCGKGEHQIFTWNTGKTRLDALSFTFEIEIYSKWRAFKWQILNLLFIKGRNLEFKVLVDIINQTIRMRKHGFFIVAFGLNIMATYQKVMLFITKMVIGVTMILPTWKLCPEKNIISCTWQNITPIQKTKKRIENILRKLLKKLPNGISQKMQSKFIEKQLLRDGKENKLALFVLFAKKLLKPGCRTPSIVQENVILKDVTLNKKQNYKSVLGAIKNFWLINIARWRVVPIFVQTENVPTRKVYNLTLNKHNVYYANNILVFNCLTFALPVTSYMIAEAPTNNIVRELASDMHYKLNAINRARKVDNVRQR